jgi:hypothetical protein
MMAAASADVPAVFVPVGPMLVGHHRGETLGACTDCRRLWSDFRGGRISAEEIDAVNGRLAPTAGTCMVMGTASTMACIVEIMGLALPHSASIPGDARRPAALGGGERPAGRGDGRERRPEAERVDDAAAFRNALVVLQAIGGSTNGLIHLTAAAGRLGIAIDLDEVDALGREVPVLVDLKPSGRHYMEHFHWAGGVPRLVHELADLARPRRAQCRGHLAARAAHGPRHARRAGRDPAVLEPDQRERQHGGAARQPRAARRDHQAVGGDARAPAAHRPRRRLRLGRGHDDADRLGRPRRPRRRRSRPAQRRARSARPECPRPATCRSRRSWRSKASRTWFASPTRE